MVIALLMLIGLWPTPSPAPLKIRGFVVLCMENGVTHRWDCYEPAGYWITNPCIFTPNSDECVAH